MFDDPKSHLKKLADFGGEVALVPYSGVQILDFGFDLTTVDVRGAKFIERVSREEDGEVERTLIPLSGNDTRDAPVLEAAIDTDDPYSVRPLAALEP